tara:strand:- start:287 stop:406 length:120 start_codon:yes stop_codon:yes gene_type:complete
MPIKRRATKAKNFTVTDAARTIWREGRGEKYVHFPIKAA